MTTLDFGSDAKFRAIEDRLGAIERDIAIIKEALKHVPSPWLIVGLILPLYGVIILGFGGLIWTTAHK